MITEIERAKSFGYRETVYRAKLYGHTPYVAPEAWFHTIYPPLTEKEINILEEGGTIRISEAFRNFLKWSNGINLFSGSLSLHGLRGLNYREGDQAIQPFNLITLNTLERPKDSKDEYLFIGSYNWDGSKLYVNNNSASKKRME